MYADLEESLGTFEVGFTMVKLVFHNRKRSRWIDHFILF